MASPTKYHQGLGRRKEATARARISKGTGIITVNGLPSAQYFGGAYLNDRLEAPLKIVSKDKSFDISIKVRGGGKTGQAEAARLAIAKALTDYDAELRPTLKKAGLVKRDARVKERKKYGLKRARKAAQFTKR